MAGLYVMVWWSRVFTVSGMAWIWVALITFVVRILPCCCNFKKKKKKWVGFFFIHKSDFCFSFFTMFSLIFFAFIRLQLNWVAVNLFIKILVVSCFYFKKVIQPWESQLVWVQMGSSFFPIIVRSNFESRFSYKF